VQTFSLHVQVENLHYKSSNHLDASSRPPFAVDHLAAFFGAHSRSEAD